MIVNECVHAYASTFTSTAANGSFHTLGMDQEVVDSGGYHDNSTNNSRITFPSGGVFLVFGGPQWEDPGGGDVYGRLAINGTATGYQYRTNGAAAVPAGFTGPMPMWLDDFSAGDYVESQTMCNVVGSFGARTQMVALEVDAFSCHVADTSSAPGPTTLTYGTVIYDPNGMATATDRIECQADGFYLILHNFLSNGGITRLYKNGSATAMYGSEGRSDNGQGFGASDFTVDYLEVGDYVQCKSLNTDTATDRQFMMVHLGDSGACVATTYNSIDLSNTDPGFAGPLRTDSEWFDVCNGTPAPGDGEFRAKSGYHLAIVKICTDGGTFLQNDACYVILEGSQLANAWSSNRNAVGGDNTTMAVACFESNAGDIVEAGWFASTLFTERAFTPFTNVFVTDCAGQDGAVGLWKIVPR